MANVLLFSGLISSFTLYRCAFDRIARTHCCCPAKQQPVEQAELRAARCCDQKKVIVARAPAEAARVEAAAPAPSLAAAPPPPPALAVALPQAEPAPPGSRPPLILLKRSFLI